MSFYSPMSFLFLIGLIPIILMYLLKKQHTDVRISSNYLWEKALRDVEANRPWQKLKKNILLLLQLLTFTALVFAIAQPYIFSDKIGGGNLIIILDTSASMQSKEKDETRFDVATKEIEKIINNLKPDTRATLITVDSNPNIIVNNSKDKANLKKRLNSIKPSSKSDNFDDTISLVKAMTKDMTSYNVIFFTDKEIITDIDNVVINNINSNSINVAIENLSHSINGNDITVLTTVTNYSAQAVDFDMSLFTDSKLHDVREISLKPNESKDVYWDNLDNKISTIKIDIDIDDALDLDNSRYHVVNSNPIKKVLLISKENIFLEKAISLNKGVDLYKSNEVIENLNGYDLYVFDGMLPKELPDDGNIIMLNPSNNQLFNVLDTKKEGELKLLNDDLFRYVKLDFVLGEAKQLEAPKWAIPVLIFDDEPVIFKGQKDKQKYIVCGFDIHNTDLPLKVDFPILIQNMLDYTLNLSRQEKTSIASGESIEIDILPKAENIYVISPNGEKEKIGPPFPLPPYTNTDETGFYTIKQDSNEQVFTNYFASNIDTLNESNTEYMRKESNNKAIQGQSKIKSERSIEDILLLCVLLLLAAEWVVYNRGY
ncbi:vWA domain-containing protein [Brassicibacter mesophilus]|uniref:vWA domain-containing protein n=1 Tax=Brassicibacter mesophilus TaxID=745119 RepID=UPI003D1B2E44